MHRPAPSTEEPRRPLAQAGVQGREKALAAERTRPARGHLFLFYPLVPDTVQVTIPPSPLTVQFLKSEDDASSFPSCFLIRCGTNFVSSGGLIHQNGSFRNQAASTRPHRVRGGQGFQGWPGSEPGPHHGAPTSMAGLRHLPHPSPTLVRRPGPRHCV